MQLTIRQATIADIPAMHLIRMAVKENALNNPDLVKEKDYEEFITVRGRGWVCLIDGMIAGFSIVDMKDKNVWALFVDPVKEGNGIGKKLHDVMLDWYFDQTDEMLWLGTAPKTRAERFYRKAGWTDKGLRPNGEVRFEMEQNEWKKRRG